MLCRLLSYNCSSSKKLYIGMIILILVVFISLNICAPQREVQQIVLVNPQYGAQYDAEYNAGEKNTKAIKTNSSSDLSLECKDANKLLGMVREQMLSRTAEFTIKYTGLNPEKVLTVDTFDALLAEVFASDDTSTPEDYDYLKLSWTKAQLTVDNYTGFTLYKFSFGYLTTVEQENALEKKADEILKVLNVYDSGDYEKVRSVNDYITQNVSYDRKHDNLSAYDAIYNGSTVCRGYALLAYTLLDKLSVPVRIITGEGKGQPHTWNLVDIDGEWYNLDVTWNDTTKSYSFFLKNEKEFYFHQKDAVFETEDFISEYPIAASSYTLFAYQKRK